MIKVMNIISDTNIGGAGKVLINYLKYCDRENFEVSVLLPRCSLLKAPLEELGTRVFEADGIADRSFDRSAIRELKQRIREEKPDIVHTHGSLSGRIAARQCGCRVIYTRHSAFPVKGYLKHGPGRWLNKWVNHHYADRIIAVSPAAAKNLTDAGVNPSLIDTMMNGVDPVQRATPEECAALRKHYGIPDGCFTVGILARIEDYKGHTDILDAIQLIRDSGREIRLIIAGTGSYEDAVRQHCSALGLDKIVCFPGFIRDVAPVLSILDLQLNASWGTETSSLSVLEGFSMALPAIVSDYGGNPCLVEEGVNGFLFPARDPGALADRIIRLMDNPALLEKMGTEALRIYRERFTGEAFARRIDAIYRKVLAEKK